MKLFIDIETIPTQVTDFAAAVAAGIKPPKNMSKAETIAKWHALDKAEAIEAAVAETSLDGLFGELYCVGLAIEDTDPVVLVREDLTPAAELRLLRQCFDFVQDHRDPASGIEWIGHYVHAFDLPFLWKRAVVLGEAPPFSLPYDARPRGDGVIDTRYLWTGNTKDHVGLDKLCLALGAGFPKGDLDGSKVWKYVRTGRGEEVVEYCRGDVIRAREVYRRLTFQPLFG